MQIGHLAQRAAVPVDTVRYYERLGLIPQPERLPSGYRDYGDDDIRRLRFIRRGKALGFTLDEIRELIGLTATGTSDRGVVRALAVRRLAEVDRQLLELQDVRDTLGRLVEDCSGQGSLAGCPIIERILGSDPPSDQVA